MRIKVWLAGAFAALLLSGGAFAQDVETKTFKDWVVRCVATNKPPCTARQQVSNDKGQQIVEILLGYEPAEKRYPLRVEVPLGIVLPPGALLKIDEAAEFPNLTFTRCLSSGCLVELYASEEMLTALRKGTKGAFVVRTADGKGAALVFSLNGFSAAVEELVGRNTAAQ
jgi:invasion protein IalB